MDIFCHIFSQSCTKWLADVPILREHNSICANNLAFPCLGLVHITHTNVHLSNIKWGTLSTENLCSGMPKIDLPMILHAAYNDDDEGDYRKRSWTNCCEMTLRRLRWDCCVLPAVYNRLQLCGILCIFVILGILVNRYPLNMHTIQVLTHYPNPKRTIHRLMPIQSPFSGSHMGHIAWVPKAQRPKSSRPKVVTSSLNIWKAAKLLV